ncbi:hypothetical protein C922_03773 [Plasmodium inui San Antonio 1]|uniref:Uncharacterized protein n=1 Tax=Plasmodium inui San Antonio 1 TaxID=1237626 RepID=W7A293_9APIC|nr:hypothetical protein C922_03773 [Plasmodium inui San Antonio 1]EUD65790.1 hypothetical protein C922_03773 [Plasmodium inui San Antonio 1]
MPHSALSYLIRIKLIIYCFKRLLLFNKYKHIQLEKQKRKKKKKKKLEYEEAGDVLVNSASYEAPVKKKLQTKTIYFIRHGESIWNSVFNRKITTKNFLNIFLIFFYELFFIFTKKSSLLDSPLSKNGIQECLELSKFLNDSIHDLENTDFCGGDELMQLEYIDKATKEMDAFYGKLCDENFDPVTLQEKHYLSIYDDFYSIATEEEKEYAKICDGDHELSELEQHFKNICDGYFDGLLYEGAKFVPRKIEGDDDYFSCEEESDEDSLEDDQGHSSKDSKSTLSRSTSKLPQTFGSQGNITPLENSNAEGPRIPDIPAMTVRPSEVPTPNMVPLPGSMPNIDPLLGSLPNVPSMTALPSNLAQMMRPDMAIAPMANSTVNQGQMSSSPFTEVAPPGVMTHNMQPHQEEKSKKQKQKEEKMRRKEEKMRKKEEKMRKKEEKMRKKEEKMRKRKEKEEKKMQKKHKKKKEDKHKNESKKGKKHKTISGILKILDCKEKSVFSDEEDYVDEEGSDSVEKPKEQDIPVKMGIRSLVLAKWRKPMLLKTKSLSAKADTTSEAPPATAPQAGPPEVTPLTAATPEVPTPKADTTTKAIARKVEETNVEETNVEEPKVKEPNVGEAEVGAPKVEVPKPGPSKVEKPNVEELKVGEAKVVFPREGAQKTVEPKVSHSTVSEPKVVEPGDRAIPQADNAATRCPALGRSLTKALTGSSNQISTSAEETPSTSSTVDTKKESNDGSTLDIPKKKPICLRRMAMENILRRTRRTSSMKSEEDFHISLSSSSVGSIHQDTSSIEDEEEEENSDNLDAFESGDSIVTEDLDKQCISENILDMSVKEHIDVLNNMKYKSVVLCSDLRRAITTCFIALQDRFKTSDENVYLLKSLQELSRNVDSITLFNFYHKYVTPKTKNYVSDDVDALIKQKVKVAPQTNKRRFLDTLSYIFSDPNNIFIIFGHSLWFLSFFRSFLEPPHKARNHKMKNSSVVVFNISKYKDEHGEEQYQIDPDSVKVVFKGFENKVYSKD